MSVGSKSKEKLYSIETVDTLCVGNVYSSSNLTKIDFILRSNCENVTTKAWSFNNQLLKWL